MYQVFFDDLTLYDPRDELRVLRDPDCRLAVGEAGEMAFTIDADHPHAGQLTKLTGTVELRAEGVSIFKGRIRKDSQEFNLSRRIEVEGLLACLNDSIIPPFDFPVDWESDAAYQAAAETGNVVRFFLEWLLAEHNGQVGAAQQITLGDVTVADPNNYIARASSEYLNTLEVVRKKLEDTLGGYLLADYSGDTTVLHYYADLPLTNIQPVEYGENLLDLVTETDAAETCTAILPLGADGLTIEELPDGEISPGYFKSGLIIYSAETEENYNGIRIIRKEEWKDVTEAQNLQTKALNLLSEDAVKLAQTISITAADLGGTDDLPRFRVGRYVELRSTPHGFRAAYPLMELEPNILDPGDTNITLGATIKTATGLAQANQNATQEKLDLQQLNTKNELNQLTQTTQAQITAAIQTAESIMLSALESYTRTSDFEAFQQTVESQFTVLSDEISLRFTETTERITNVDGDLQKTLETLAKHFIFALDGLTIKAGENAMSLKLDNGLISFQLNGLQFGWWDGVDFHTGNIVIDVTERAQFGNFAFVPRSNGSLSFLKVGG